MMTKSPSGALSPYYYKGGYFHGIHYGDYFDNSVALLAMMSQEEAFILKSSEKRRILIDFYQTNLSVSLIEKVVKHIENISPRIIKIAFSTDKKSLCQLQKAIVKGTSLGTGMTISCYLMTPQWHPVVLPQVDDSHFLIFYNYSHFTLFLIYDPIFYI